MSSTTRSAVLMARRVMLWAIPIVLVAALAWSLMPRGGPQPNTAPRPPAAATPPQQGGTAQTPVSSGAQAPAAADSRAAQAGKGIPNGEMRSGHLVDTDASGRRRWQITADDIALAEGGQVMHLRNVHAVFYDPNGSAMTVSGARGVYDTRTKEVRMTGDVHGVSANGRQIFADELNYAPGTEQVTGTGNIRVVEERVIMYSDRMVSDTRLGQTQFFGHVHMTVR
ncbi:MAG TPA: LPS export ABC transporter periplasmic protein LptC [bacterium]|nr:LPS export ABC transporter periplasmic protein LptC [bacterium]